MFSYKAIKFCNEKNMTAVCIKESVELQKIIQRHQLSSGLNANLLIRTALFRICQSLT